MPTSYKERVKHFLSLKEVTLLILLAAVIARVIQIIFFYNIMVDASYQVLATENFVKGHGVSLGSVFPQDLSKTVYQPLINWPPGYSILLAPFYIVMGYQYIPAGIALDIAAAIVLIIVLRKILNHLKVPIYGTNIFTLFTGFFIYPFYFIPSSDSIAIPFLLIGIYTSVLLCSSDKRQTLVLAVLTISLFLAAFIKYLFTPIVFVVPIALYTKGLAQKNKSLKRSALAILGVLTFSLGSVLIYQKSISGEVGYISSTGRGFFPDHLLTAYPFTVAAFIKPDTISLLLNTQYSNGNVLYRIFQSVHLMLFIAIVLHFIRRSIRYKNLQSDNTSFFLTMSFAISLLITGLLAFLSFTVSKEEILPGWFWTYIEEPRYYGLPILLCQLSLFVLWYKYRHRHKYIVYMIWGVAFLLAVEFSRGVYFNTRRVVNFNKEEYSWQYEKRFQDYADSVLKHSLTENGVDRAVVTSSNYYWSHRISLNSHIPILYQAESINQVDSIRTTKTVLLMAVIEKHALPFYKPFLTANNQKPKGAFDNFFFYTQLIKHKY